MAELVLNVHDTTGAVLNVVDGTVITHRVLRGPVELTAGPGAAAGSDTTFVVTEAPFNATGDGVADDTEALEDAIAAAVDAGGGIVLLPVGTYKIRRTLFLGPNVVLQGEGFGSVITKGDTVTANLTANRNAGGTTITVADSSAFSVGDAVTVSDTTNYEWAATQAVVASKTSTTIELDAPAQAAYQTTRSARIFTSFPLISNVADGDEGIVVRDLTLDQNAGPNDPTNEFTIGTIHWVGAYGALVDGVQFLGACGDAYSDQSQDGTGLDVTYPQAASIRRSTRNTITNCRIIAPRRHGVHLGTAQDGAIVTGNEIRDISNTLGMALFFCAYSTNATIDGNLVANCAQGFAGGDLRDTGNVISNNVFQGGTNSQQSGSLYAIDCGAQTTITGNQILDWRGGIRIGADSVDCTVTGNFVRIAGTRECLTLLAGADRCTVSNNVFTGGSAGSKAVSLVSVDDCVFTGNITYGTYTGWSISGCNRLRILASPIVSATVAYGFTLESSASTDVEIDTRGTVQASGVVRELVTPTRLLVNGVGSNGSTNPASGGDWNAINPATTANKRYEGVLVHWNDGTDHISQYRHGVGWIELTGGSSGSVATDAIWDAKGDLAVGTGANTAAKLSAGTNGHVLTLDSAETAGMKWAAVPGGGATAGEFYVIHDEILASDGLFSPPSLAGYSDIELILDGRSTNAGATGSLRIQFNGDTGSNYFRGAGTAATSFDVGVVPGSLTNTDRSGRLTAEFHLGGTAHYTTGFHTNYYWSSTATAGTAATTASLYYTNRAAAITSINVFLTSSNQFAAGSRLTIKARA